MKKSAPDWNRNISDPISTFKERETTMNTSKKILIILTAAAVAVMAFMPQVHAASFLPILSPDAAYLAGTTKIALIGADGTFLGAISDASLTVTFDYDRYITEFDGWACPPETESCLPVPRVLLDDEARTSMIMDLSHDVSIFGFEAGENPFGIFDLTADFYDGGGALVGSITREVDSSLAYPGKLFAASTDGAFRRVAFSCAGCDFAIGQVRYQTPGTVPEPTTLMLLASGLLLVFFGRRKK